VEQAFRCLKGLDLRVRPIHHRIAPRVSAHLFVCLLAYAVEWQMRKVLKPLLYEDEDLEEAREQRDPVNPAEPSASTREKKRRTGPRLGKWLTASPVCWPTWERGHAIRCRSRQRSAPQTNRPPSSNSRSRTRFKPRPSACLPCSQNLEILTILKSFVDQGFLEKPGPNFGLEGRLPGPRYVVPFVAVVRKVVEAGRSRISIACLPPAALDG
jgi:hypothetical protein